MASRRTESAILLVVGVAAAAIWITDVVKPGQTSAPPDRYASEEMMRDPASGEAQQDAVDLGSLSAGERESYSAGQENPIMDRRPARPQGFSDAATNRQRDVEAMTQAARAAGYSGATANQLGRDAAALCNGNPECLK